jgi:hypothetical protein
MPNPAEMVELQTWRNGADEVLIGPPVRLAGLPIHP